MPLLVLALVIVLAGGLPQAVAQETKITEPDASLTPGQVARIQVEALGRNNTPYPDRGIEIN